MQSQIADFLKRVDLSYYWVLYGGIFSFLFGIFHTFSPGHGKTIVCGYFIGKKRDNKKIIFVSAVTVITHLFSSILLGIIAATSSQILVRSIILPKVQITAGIILIIIGVIILTLNFVERDGHQHDHHAGHEHDHDHHHHDHEHDHAEHHHGHSHEKMNSWIQRYVDSEDSSRQTTRLIFLGLGAGMIPCLEAFTLMVFAIVFNKILLGFIFLMFFGLGVFTTMLALAFVFTSEKFTNRDMDQTFWVRTAQNLSVVFKVAYPVIIIALGIYRIYRGFVH